MTKSELLLPHIFLCNRGGYGEAQPGSQDVTGLYAHFTPGLFSQYPLLEVHWSDWLDWLKIKK